MVRWRATAVPAPVVDYAAKLVELSESYQPEGEDGWPLLLEATVIFNEVKTAIAEMEFRPRDDESDAYLDFDRAYDPKLTDLEPERLALEMLRERGTFDRLAQAAARPRSLRPLKGAASPLLLNVLLPELMDFVNLAKGRVASMCLALREGDGDEAAAALEQTLALARATGSQALLIDRFVGNRIGALAAGQLRYVLQEEALDEATCLALLAAMDRQRPLPPVELALEGERLFLLDTIQWSFTDDGHGDGRFDSSKAGSLLGGATATGVGGRLQSMFLAGRAETTRLANDFFDKTVAESRLNPVARAASPFDPDDFASKLSTRQLLKVMIPALGSVLRTDNIVRVQTQGTRLMLALEAYRARHGYYPARLEQLVPEILRELPADPTHGGPFAYRLLEADPHGRGYLLYSTGLDQTDDGGALPAATQHPYAALRDASATGIDYVINQPRPQGD